MTLAVDGAAVAAGAEGPERRGGAGEVQTDVPERVYRGGDPAGRVAVLRYLEKDHRFFACCSLHSS